MDRWADKETAAVEQNASIPVRQNVKENRFRSEGKKGRETKGMLK